MYRPLFGLIIFFLFVAISSTYEQGDWVALLLCLVGFIWVVMGDKSKY